MLNARPIMLLHRATPYAKRRAKHLAWRRAALAGLVFTALSSAIPSVASAEAAAQWTPFVNELMTHWSTFDKNADGIISLDEVNSLVTDPSITGDTAAAAASLKLMTRLKNEKSKTPLPPLDKAYFDSYNSHALSVLKHDSLKNAVSETSGAEGLTEEATKPADSPASWDRYFVASKKRISAVAGDHWRDSDYALDDVRQGPMGDCFFVASATTLSIHRPDYLHQLIQQLPDGSYRATFPGAKPFTFPGLTPTQLAISGQTTGQGAWLAVLEQGYGRYRAMLKAKPADMDGTEMLYKGGDSKMTLTALTGNVINRIAFPRYVEESVAKRDTILPALRAALVKAIADHRAITAGILPPKKAEAGKTPISLPPNIVANHVYAVVDYDATTDTVEIWNPHGQHFTPTGEPGPANGYVTEHGHFKLPLAEAYSFYTSFTFETDAPATQKAE